MESRTDQASRLLSAKALSQMLSLSKRQIFRLNSCRELPEPLRMGGAARWSADEIPAWPTSQACREMHNASRRRD